MRLMKEKHARFGRFYTQLLSKYKLSIQHYTMLYLLKHEGATQMNSMAKSLGVTNPAVTNFVDTLEKRTMIKRIPSQKDRRVILLEITPEGQAILDTCEEKCTQLISRTFEEFDTATQKNILKFFEKVLLNFDKELSHENN